MRIDRIDCWCISPFASKAQMKFGGSRRPSTGLRTSRLLQHSYLPLLPKPVLTTQCIDYGVRSCLPLRDSSGFTPDSLVIANRT